MITRNLGISSIKIGAIGQGTGFEFKGNKNTDKAVKVLREGINLGLNFIDTAENYASGLAEQLVGKAVKGIRQNAVIASKFSAENSKYEQVIKSCENSLKRLKTDYIDLYQLHWPNPIVPFEETFSALLKLKKKGYIREIGICNFSARELFLNKKLLIDNKTLSLQSEYNLFERTVEKDGIFNFCKKNKFTFIAYSPLDQGRFDSMNKEQKRLVQLLSKKYSTNPSQIVLSWIISNDFVVAIPKTLNFGHLRDNAHTLEFSLDKSDIEKISNAFLTSVKYVAVDKIQVSKHGERQRGVYTTLKEAKENRLNFIPSPLDLALSLKTNSFLRPVRLVPSKGKPGHYHLINGRIRYWAWVLAFGDKNPIPAYIRNNLE